MQVGSCWQELDGKIMMVETDSKWGVKEEKI